MTPEKEEEFMNNTGWKVLGLESDTRIAEFKAENPDNKLVSYEEAKADALKRLRDHVAPYLARIEELEQDEFLETGALPPLKAWRCDYGHKTIVVAKTKKRAAELTGDSQYGFNSSWDVCEGDWWYHLAQEEAVWVEERDDERKGTGVYYKPVSREEAEQILELFISPYRTVDIDELVNMVGQTLTVTSVSSQGTPYRIKIEAEQGVMYPGQEGICVRIRIDDCLGWKWLPSASVVRDLPRPDAVETEEWAKEGF